MSKKEELLKLVMEEEKEIIQQERIQIQNMTRANNIVINTNYDIGVNFNGNIRILHPKLFIYTIKVNIQILLKILLNNFNRSYKYLICKLGPENN